VIALIIGAVVLAVVLSAVTLVQILYMESLRLRARELPMLEFFRSTLEERIGISDDHGVLAFSIVKHTCLVALVLVVMMARLDHSTPFWQVGLESAGIAWLTMLISTYVVPHLLYRKTDGRWLMTIAPILKALAFAVRPLAAMLAFFQSLVELAEPEAKEAEQPTPAEHIEALISAGTEEGIIEETDRKLIQSVVAF